MEHPLPVPDCSTEDPPAAAGPEAGGETTGQALAGLLRLVAAGDQSAFARLYDATGGRLYVLALRITGAVPDAESVTVEVYAEVWQRAGEFDPETGSAWAWLTALARARALERLRSSPGGPQRALPGPETIAGTHALLDALPPPQRQAIELAYFAGLSTSELAAVLGQPPAVVRSLLGSGLRELRRRSREAG